MGCERGGGLWRCGPCLPQFGVDGPEHEHKGWVAGHGGVEAVERIAERGFRDLAGRVGRVRGSGWRGRDLFDGGLCRVEVGVGGVRGLVGWNCGEGFCGQTALDKGVDEPVPGGLVGVAVGGKIPGNQHHAVCDGFVDWRELGDPEVLDIPSLQKRPDFSGPRIGVTTLAVMHLPHCGDVLEQGRL